jgi:hypothetical protein
MSMSGYSGGPNPAMMASAVLAKWYNSKNKKPTGKQGTKPEGTKPTGTTPTTPTSTTPKPKKAREATQKDIQAALKAKKITPEEAVRLNKGYGQKVAKRKLATEQNVADKAKAKPVKKAVPAKKTTKPKPPPRKKPM